MKRFGMILAVLALSVGAVATDASAETRIALVIGNSSYRYVPSLDNPTGDARMVAGTLKSLGFSLVGDDAQINLDKPALDMAIRSFGARLQGADVGLFYYAGHGVQIRGANYLVPVNANPIREADVDFELEDVSIVLRQMEGAGTRLNLVTLDACRNNPFGGRGLRSADAGLAQMRAPEGTLISFATQPGNVAQDGFDGHSPYSRALAQTISRPGLGVFDAFNEVGLRVKKSTGGVQQPWVSSSPIDGSFYFAGMSKPAVELPKAAETPAKTDPPFLPVAKIEPTTVVSPKPDAPEQKVAMLTPDARLQREAAPKSPEQSKADRGVAIYDGRWRVSSSSGCPHITGGIGTVKNGVMSGRDLTGRVSANGQVSGSFGGLFPGRFSGRMNSATVGGGTWRTAIGCTGTWRTEKL